MCMYVVCVKNILKTYKKCANMSKALAFGAWLNKLVLNDGEL